MIVHAHYLSSFGLMAAIAVRLARRGSRPPRLVETAWGTDLLVTARRSRIRRRLAQFTLCSADLATGDSLDLQDEIARLAPGLEFRRFVFGPDAARYESRLPKRRVVLSSRRLVRDMRVDLIIRAFQIARGGGDLDDWRLVIAGSGPEESRLGAMAAASPEIDFVGQLSAGPLGELLDSSSVFVSVPISDATSASLLEAMAAGQVAVVNDLPANREWVDHSVGEIVARDPSPEELSEALARAVSRTHAASASQAARDRVRSVSWQGELARLIEAYRELRVTNRPRADG
jgi:glycosyltransferase involved in cell wall biosynthesis